MLGKTHLAVGIATALAISQPHTARVCFAAIIGGAVGGVLPDVDTMRTDGKLGAPQTQAFAAAVTASLLLLDSILGTGLWKGLVGRDNQTMLIGGGLFIALWIWGYFSDHRSFTHSILAMCLFAGAVNIIYPPFSVAFLVGYGSHLLLDLLNRRPLRVLYPLDSGMCFGLCYSNKTANTIFLYAGCLAAVYFIITTWL